MAATRRPPLGLLRLLLQLLLSLAVLLRHVTAEQSGAQLREVAARVVAVLPGDPGRADVLLTWPAFDKAAQRPSSGPGSGTDAVVAYEVQSTVSGADAWTSLSASVSGMAEAAEGPPRADRHERQRIFTRADAGETIADGFFRLEISHARSSALDVRQHSVTPPMAFDASALDVQRALESLDVVSRVQVFRRALDAAAGTVEWLVLFDPLPHNPPASDDHGDLPLLALYSETISAAYSGAGDQVAIQSVRDGALENPTCTDECTLLVRGISANGETLAFRVRGQWAARGWSDWSAASAPLTLPATRLPHAPSPPELLAASATRLTVQWTSNEDDALLVFPVTAFHLQQRCDRELSWRTVDDAIAPGRTRTTVASSLAPLRANTSCEFRVRAANANGIGPFSAASAPFRTEATAPTMPPRALAVERVPTLALTWQPPEDNGGAAIGAYELELRAFASSTWTRVGALLSGDARRWDPTTQTPALATFTRYVARIRARNAVGASAFAEFPHFLTDYRAPNETTKTMTATASETSPSETVAITKAAVRANAANTGDPQYVHGVAFGAQARAADGDQGAVLLFPITFGGERLDELAYFFTGAAQTLRIARAETPGRQVVAVDAYAWGGGGGAGDKTAFGTGGGGAFARGIFRVAAGDVVQIRVGGGGQGAAQGGRGGWNGGGNGGAGAFPGGGGGGLSDVRVNDKTVLVAAGGGGGGSSDYCCARGGGGGGGGGGGEAVAEDGLWPDAAAIPLDARLTGLTRNEYHSVNVEGDLRDFVGLPARHAHLDYGFAAASADYSTLATGGGGASATRAGFAGQPASFEVSRAGQCFLQETSSGGALAIGASFAVVQATPGRRARGGNGQDGQDCGGGGGAGYFGGGGGGAGIDGAGGGGGSSFVAADALFRRQSITVVTTERVANFSARAITSTSVELTWSPPRFGFAEPVEGFVVELANRSANEDFRVKRVLSPTASRATLIALAPLSWYRVRVRPLFRDAARGVVSDALAVQTLRTPVNTWRRVRGVRSEDDRTTHAGARALDALPARRLPSARRGHSLTAFDDAFLYLFGGFSAGYACSQAHKARCVVSNGVTNELWRFDTRTRTWLELRTVGGPPPAREKHSMAVVASHLLLFGGRQGGADDAAAALNDLWSLQISSTTRKTTTATLRDRETTLAIRDGQETWTLANVGHAPDLCVADLVVTLDLTHACAQTLRIELLGPGPSTHPQRQHSATSPVDSQTAETTWSDAAGFATGQKRTTPPAASARSFPATLQRPELASSASACLAGRRTLSFDSAQSLEPLAVFRQFSAAGGWTLGVVDTALDGKTGTLHSWDIAFTLAPCVPAWTWTNVGATATGTAPSARFQHAAVVYQSAMFVFGGRSATGARPLSDLYRFDYNAASSTGAWTTLRPVSVARDSAFFLGRPVLVTPYELLAVGQGLRARATSQDPHTMRAGAYVARKSVTETLGGWQQLSDARVVPEDGENAPPLGRYWSAATFTNDPTPRVFLFGGQDDTTLLEDLWELQLDALVESDPTAELEARRVETCAWRLANAAFQQAWAASCGASAASVIAGTATECSLDTLLQYAWCAKTYQSVQL